MTMKKVRKEFSKKIAKKIVSMSNEPHIWRGFLLPEELVIPGKELEILHVEAYWGTTSFVFCVEAWIGEWEENEDKGLVISKDAPYLVREGASPDKTCGTWAADAALIEQLIYDVLKMR